MKKKLTRAIVALALLTGLVWVGTASATGGPAVITGTNGDDVLRGNRVGGGAQYIYGLAGDDRIWGGLGSDHVFGGAGADRLHSFQAGEDSLDGGPGNKDVCVLADGAATDEAVNCETITFRAAQGHG